MIYHNIKQPIKNIYLLFSEMCAIIESWKKGKKGILYLIKVRPFSETII